MDPETKKAAEFCQIAGVGHVVASKPPLKPIERYRTEERMPDYRKLVITEDGFGFCAKATKYKPAPQWFIGTSWRSQAPTWWAYLPEGDE